MPSKNSTRIASLLGTWTGQTHLKTEIGSYELEAYFVIHLMPDPMLSYSCSLKDCSEFENHACMLDKNNDGVCKDIPSTIIDWSDVSAFMYFGAKIDVGFPFNKHRAQDTGDWIGPINMIMAQGDTSKDPNVVDRYVSRFVESPSTEFITMPKNCSLLRKEDFKKIAGVDAVRETAKGQFDPNNKSGDKDPYEKYLGTCANGDVKPLLPLFQFDFIRDEGTEEEKVEVKLDYKLMTMPHKKDYMYNIFPKIQNRVNRMGFGFHISGPYCFGDDPKRAYSFDMNFDTNEPKKMLKLEHSCIEGLPCTPPAADLYIHSGSSNIDVKPLPDDAVSVNIVSSILFTVSLLFLIVLILLLFKSNIELRKRLEAAQEDQTEVGGNDLSSQLIEESNDTLTPYEAMGNSEDAENDEEIENGETQSLITGTTEP